MAFSGQIRCDLRPSVQNCTIAQYQKPCKISYTPYASYVYVICSNLLCREESFLYILNSVLYSQLDPLKWCDPYTLPFKSIAILQCTIADQFVPGEYPYYGNLMICNNVKRLTSKKKEKSNTSLLAYWYSYQIDTLYPLHFLKIQLC